MTRFVSTRNIRFMIREVFNADSLTTHPYYDRHTPKMFDMVTDAAVKLATQLMYPVLTEMDQNPPVLENGQVKVHKAVNVVHLMLARMEKAPPGAKGISLFVVPKKRLDDKGHLVSNDVTTAAVYHKLGGRGIPALELSMGEKDDCHGWLVGEENKGLSHM